MTDVAAFIKQVARGKHGSEHLSRDDARRAFAALLAPDADPLQLGAFLIAQRIKGETSQELIGFVEATRQSMPNHETIQAFKGAVDLPCYAGKRRAAHAYLVAALQARDAGIPVFVHGVSHISGRITAWQVLQHEGIQQVYTLQDAAQCMHEKGMVYMDLADISPDLYRIYQLRNRLGVRTFANTVARLLNPLQCSGQLNGFFHTPYAQYMAEANIGLQQARSLIFMGAEGEPELYADRQKVAVLQEHDAMHNLQFSDAGFPAYPRNAIEPLADMMHHFQAMKQHPTDAEQARIARMFQAFRWASGVHIEEQPYA